VPATRPDGHILLFYKINTRVWLSELSLNPVK
jgi:hypothetical protein